MRILCLVELVEGRVCRDLRQDRLVFTQKDKKEKEEGGEMRKLSLFHLFLFFLLAECRATPVATNPTVGVWRGDLSFLIGGK